uniref:Fork-head domain-containing protein n=1 Tax=Romanomermis culicivorax TaxID=13658 RepID=A0A915IY20_ROMCU
MENQIISSFVVTNNNKETMSCPRERSNTWPATAAGNNISFQSDQILSNFDSGYSFSDNAAGLDLIDESNENAAACQLSCSEIQVETSRRPPKVSCNRTSASSTGHHPSYVELITTAISSHPDKRMTLSEIYDWLSDNVPIFQQQRHLHSSAGWKVRFL